MSAVIPTSLVMSNIYPENKEPLRNNLVHKRNEQKKELQEPICENLVHAVDCAINKKFPPEILNIICSYEGNTISKTNALLDEIFYCDGRIQDMEFKLNLRVSILYNHSGRSFRICNLFLKNDVYWRNFFNDGATFTSFQEKKEFNCFFIGSFLPWKQKITNIWKQFLTHAKFLSQLDLSHYRKSDKKDLLSMAACILNQEDLSGIQKLILPHEIIENPSSLCCCVYSFPCHNSSMEELTAQLQKFSLDTKKINIEVV